MSKAARDADGQAEPQAFRRAGHALVDGVADHLAALPSGPVWQPLPDALREQLLDLPLPERGGTLDDLVATALRDVLPQAMGNGHPFQALRTLQKQETYFCRSFMELAGPEPATSWV